MASEFDSALAYVLGNEGVAFTQTAADRGGATKMGISQPTLTEWKKAQGNTSSATADEVKSLSLGEATSIYRVMFWNKICGDAITDWPIATMLMDAAVLTGVTWASKQAQTVAAALGQTGLLIDGRIGPKTLAAINACDRRAFILAFMARQQSYFIDIVLRNATQRVFLKNWIKRAAYYADLVFAIN